MTPVVIGPCELWLGDCKAVLPMLAPGIADAVVTDPPYGIGITRSHRLATSRGMGGGTWDDEPADMSWLLPMNLPAIVWGGNYFDLPPARGFLVWDKNNAGRDFADCEQAWTNLDMVARRIIQQPMNMDGGKLHPAQKPIRVIKWCLDFLPDARTILDPYMGSGTTLIACIRTGRNGIGIERDPKYFDLACRRVEREVSQPDLYRNIPKAETQDLYGETT